MDAHPGPAHGCLCRGGPLCPPRNRPGMGNNRGAHTGAPPQAVVFTVDGHLMQDQLGESDFERSARSEPSNTEDPEMPKKR